MWGETVRSETMEQWGAVSAGRGTKTDPRVVELGNAVRWTRRELDAYPADLRDRREAERVLDALAATARSGVPAPEELRDSLLVLAAAVGSVSALSRPLAAVRAAVELFGAAPRATR
ncbi:DUF5955 family protein [Streptomyces albus]|uniref:DUF5955 family protein n=1 Tax=Streptomyces albus TaxID=1888 RepID=UPI000ACE4F18|nr:DUF5955 family protein [Streptomyces albus]